MSTSHYILNRKKPKELDMSEEKLDALSQNKEEALLSFYSRMENLRLEFAQETVDFAKEWYEKTARLYVTKFIEVTSKMSEKRLYFMKVRVNELIKGANDIVEFELSNPELWWHKRPKAICSVSLYTQAGNKYPEILDRAVRHILGSLGAVLEAFGYNVTTQGNSMVFPEFWFDSTNGQRIVPYYPHTLEWSKNMQITIAKYNEQYTQALELFKEVQELKNQNKQMQVGVLWDSIEAV